VGYKFTLVLNREITEEESAALREAGCADAVFGADTLPTNADVPVTKLDFDTTSSPTLAEAIQAALDAVKKVPELSVPGLTVPAQPAGPVDEDEPTVVAGEKPEVVAEERAADEEPAEKKTAAKKTSGKKSAAKKSAAKKAGADAAADDEAVPANAGSA
jgi:hypothetical protein